MNKASVLAALVLVAVGLSVSYYFVVFLPKLEEQKFELQKQEQAARLELEKQKQEQEQANTWENKQNLKTCLGQAATSYVEDWNACLAGGNRANCSLFLGSYYKVEQDYKNSKEDCFKQYPQK